MTSKKITRTRIIKSCQYCYTHKTKCDKKSPCGTCTKLNIQDNCIYGFSKTDISITSKISKPKIFTNSTLKLPEDTSAFRSKYFYPFFTGSVNDQILSNQSYNKITLIDSIGSNEITKFDRFALSQITISEIFELFPSSKEIALTQIETYFDCVHPVIPIVDYQTVLKSLDNIYSNLGCSPRINILEVLLIISILFCSAYATVASGIIPDLLLCNKYYAAYKYLMNKTEFIIKPHLESLQAFIITNFITDPNMTDSTSYSPMLVRMGQQLNLNKVSYLLKTPKNLGLLWHYILYIDGSSSVGSGLPFSTTPGIFKMVPILECQNEYEDETFPIEFSIGRFQINRVFRDIMETTVRKTISECDHDVLVKNINELYKQINNQVNSIKSKNRKNGEYFSSTLYIFLYRLHLRYYALENLKNYDSSENAETQSVVNNSEQMDIMWILNSKQDLVSETIPLTLLLLFYTLKRLVQKDVNNLAWYTRGSTVMQYLLVTLRDIYQNPQKLYSLDMFAEPFRSTIAEDIEDIIQTDPLLYKYVLIEELIKLIELKLTPLWKKSDVYKFILVKAVKETVWSVNKNVIESKQALTDILHRCKLFATGGENLENTKSISIEDCMDQWDSDVEYLDPKKIFMDWLTDFQ